MYSCIDRFQSRGQQLFKLLGIKVVLTYEKSSILTGFFLYTNMAADPLFCTQIWPPWSCENDLFMIQNCIAHPET